MVAAVVVVAAVLTVAVALLAVPLVLTVDAERVGEPMARWHVRWLFGLVDFGTATIPGEPASEPSCDVTMSPGTSDDVKMEGKGSRIGLAVLRTRGLLRGVGRLASRLLRQVTLERFHLRAEVGLDNPADTGVLFGMLSVLLVMAEVHGLDVCCRPMFLESGVKGAFEATVRLRPLFLVTAILGFLLSPPVLRAVGAAWRARR